MFYDTYSSACTALLPPVTSEIRLLDSDFSRPLLRLSVSRLSIFCRESQNTEHPVFKEKSERT